MVDEVKPKKINDNRWIIKKHGTMKVPGTIFANDMLMSNMINDRTLKQLVNVASLPGIIRSAYLMPDGHEGYGFPIGGVAAFSEEDGIISPGGVGYDINCGVRVIKTNLKYEEIKPKLKNLVDEIYKNCPSGVGSKGKLKLNNEQLADVLELGIDWAIENDFAWESDRDYIEENGRMDSADPTKISSTAYKRGRAQLGTVGSGNHFIEIQEVSEIINEEVAHDFGLFKGQAVIMIHMGSRGLGHQVAADYIRKFSAYITENGITLPDRELVYAPISSDLGQEYIAAMAGAVNFAFANRQLLTHWIRESFSYVLREDPIDLEMDILYDVAHNIAKRERHKIEDGSEEYLWVHRKGATRAMPQGREELPLAYRNVGQPVLIPGSMGTASYVLVGRESSAESFHSVCHGAGRTMSRKAAVRSYPPSEVNSMLKSKGIYVKTSGKEIISEEAPGAYKSIDDVIKTVEGAGLAEGVVKLIPHGVVKG